VNVLSLFDGMSLLTNNPNNEALIYWKITYKGGSVENYFKKSRRQMVYQDDTHDTHSLVVSPIREKSKTVRSGGRGSYDRHEWDSVDELHWRKLTPIECERLQTVPDNYTNHVSNTQRYKMLGNGWTIEVIAHILRGV